MEDSDEMCSIDLQNHMNHDAHVARATIFCITMNHEGGRGPAALKAKNHEGGAGGGC